MRFLNALRVQDKGISTRLPIVTVITVNLYLVESGPLDISARKLHS